MVAIEVFTIRVGGIEEEVTEWAIRDEPTMAATEAWWKWVGEESEREGTGRNASRNRTASTQNL